MVKELSFLEEAQDFLVLTEKTFYFEFNEYRGGSFDKVVPEQVTAYGTTWEVSLKWRDAGWVPYDVMSGGLQWQVAG